MKGGMATLGMKSPIFLPGPVQPQFGPGRMLYFEGFSVDETGKQHYLDTTVAYRQTTLRCIEYMKRFGYSDYQIYLLLSCAPVEGHVAGIVDVSDFSSCLFDQADTLVYRFRTPAQLWVCQWISLTLISHPGLLSRSWIWDPALCMVRYVRLESSEGPFNLTGRSRGVCTALLGALSVIHVSTSCLMCHVDCDVPSLPISKSSYIRQTYRSFSFDSH